MVIYLLVIIFKRITVDDGGRLLAGLAGSNPTGSLDVCLL
jgi:hypothetical protein